MTKKWVIHRAKSRRYKKGAWKQRHKTRMVPSGRKFFGQMRQLPIVKIGSKNYFVDARLSELRNIKNPHDREKMEGSEEFYVKNFGVPKIKAIKSLSRKPLRDIDSDNEQIELGAYEPSDTYEGDES